MMKKERAGIIFVSAVFVLVMALALFLPKQGEYSKVCFGNNCFEVETARTQEERARGLMFRENLSENRGMLFVFEEEGIHPFWMKNTLIPLDIIWIDSNKKIVYISRDTQPCKTEFCQSYNPNKAAKYVLEINGGLADKLNIKEGGNAEYLT